VSGLGRWTPTPFTQFVLKLTSRCDLACEYCYVFGDDAWRDLPRTMPEEVVEATAARMTEHAQRHATPTVRVVLHGGEPLLAGVERLDRTASVLRKTAARSGIEVLLSLQTNGVLLHERMLDVLRRHRIRVGVSLDGSAEMHDRHRRRRDGRGSHSATARALGLLRRPENSAVYVLEPADLICVGTDGAIEQVDSLKVVSPHAAATGLDVRTHNFDDALRHRGVVARQRGLSALAATCLECPIVGVCGGGLYSHRYRDGGFGHPSVYCPDLYALILHIRHRMDVHLRALRRR
jgi:sulfatase maturation enzyme AslB (radical SAM superfamily)